ncbi:MAG TPA: NHL repeat-containing protein, partial [Solirubrobacterales bacterium]|nr:NHL repeat-containing protein [Solirubrobacterales bacterium]
MRPVPRRRLALVAILVATAALALPAAALGAHSLRYVVSQVKPPPEPEYLEDPCGVAVDSHGNVYVSDYYHDKIRIFSPGGGLITEISDVDPVDGPCGLAVDPAGRIYANSYHEGVLRLTPSAYPPTGGTTYSKPVTVIGGVNATGIALDPVSGNLLVDERTSVAEYEAPVEPGAEPLRRIGTGPLEDGYGVAVSGFGATKGFVYAADAADAAIEVYDPATSLTEPVATLEGEGTALGRFNDLSDAALAVDDSDGHLYVVDNVDGRLYEHPHAAIEEFDAAGVFVGEILSQGTSGAPLVHGRPTGIAVDNTSPATLGDLYVTSGNSERSALLAFGPWVPGPLAPAMQEPAPTLGSAVSMRGSSASAGAAPASASADGGGRTVVQRGHVRVSLGASIAPDRLPRRGRAPVTVSIDADIAPAGGSKPRQLRLLRIEINREGQVETAGLPVC